MRRVATMITAVVAAALLVACSSDATERAGGSLPSGSSTVEPAASGPSVAATSTPAPGVTAAVAVVTIPVEQPSTTSSSAAPTTPVPSDTKGEVTTTRPSSTSSTARPTTTTLPLITSPGVVLVANASNVDGAAKRMTDELAFRGFTTVKATSAAGIETDLTTSKVYVLPGSEAVARSVARLLGGLKIAYMPTPVSISGGPANLRGATVVVMLGSDLAGKPLPT